MLLYIIRMLDGNVAEILLYGNDALAKMNSVGYEYYFIIICRKDRKRQCHRLFYL